MDIALCLAGKIGSLKHKNMQMHWMDVMNPILPYTSIFAHVTYANISLSDIFTKVTYYSQSDDPSSVEYYNACPQPKTDSNCTGYQLSSKWYGCMEDILEFERNKQREFKFIFRTRPDLEYGSIVPHITEWMTLRTDIVWVMIAQKTLSKCHPGYSNYLKIDEISIPSKLFIDDNVAITHRKNIKYILDLKEYFLDCNYNTRICQHRNLWPECQVLRALETSNLYIARIPFLTHFSFIDCAGKSSGLSIEKWKNKDCTRIHRRKCCGRVKQEHPTNIFLEPSGQASWNHFRSDCSKIQDVQLEKNDIQWLCNTKTVLTHH